MNFLLFKPPSLSYCFGILHNYCLLHNGLKQVAQGQYVDRDIYCPALHDCKSEKVEAGKRPQRGLSHVKFCESQGEFCSSISLFIHPSSQALSGLKSAKEGIHLSVFCGTSSSLEPPPEENN